MLAGTEGTGDMDVLTLLMIAGPALGARDAPAPPASAVPGPVVLERFVPAPPRVPVAVAGQQPAFRYSAAYYRRLDVHRYASYAILPLFAFQFAAGTQLYDKNTEAPAWARTGHRIGATAIAALFVTNSVTGVWNLWEGRKDPDRGKRPVVHAIMMLAADAGFTATGLLAERAERSPDDRRMHRTVALSSMAVATTAYLLMLDIFDRE
jgi:hypothetical protein